MKVDFKLTGVDGVLDLLQKLPPEVVSKRGGPAKKALLAGARVLLAEAALNLARAVDALGPDGEEQSTGLLLANVVATRGKPPTSGKGERYLVRVRRKSYKRKGAKVTTRKTASLLEYGSEKQPAEPWLRPAFRSKAPQAVSTVESVLVREIDAVVRRLARKGRR